MYFVLDVAEFALHQCVERFYEADDKGCCHIAKIRYSYEFLDDFITPKPSLYAFLADMFRWNHEHKHEKIEHGLRSEIALGKVEPKSEPTVQGTQCVDDEGATDEPKLECDDKNWLQKFSQTNHPLELMVSFNLTACQLTKIQQL